MHEQVLTISNIDVPQYYLPNPLGVEAEKINKAFASSVGLFKLIDEKKFYAASSIGKFAYHQASLERLSACCQFVEWLFYIDDEFDENIEFANNTIAAKDRIEQYIQLFCNGTSDLSNDPIVQFSIGLREKLLKTANPQRFERICNSTKEYFRIGVLGAVEVWGSKQPYTIEQYMLNREYDSGVYACIDMIEIAEDIDISNEIITDPDIQKLRKLTVRHVAFTNDLYSYNKEVPQHHNPNNLVYLLMHWKKKSFEEAVNEIVKILNAEVQMFVQLKEKILSTYSSPDLQKYIAGMESWMSGNINWSIQTTRYKIPTKNTHNTLAETV